MKVSTSLHFRFERHFFSLPCRLDPNRQQNMSISNPMETFVLCARIELASSPWKGDDLTTCPTEQVRCRRDSNPQPLDRQSSIQPLNYSTVIVEPKRIELLPPGLQPGELPLFESSRKFIPPTGDKAFSYFNPASGGNMAFNHSLKPASQPLAASLASE